MKEIHGPSDTASMTARFRATLVIDSLPEKPSAWRTVYRKIIAALGSVWSATSFEDSKMSDYAREMMLEETRKGIAIMAALSFCTQFSAVLLFFRLGMDQSFLYTYGLLALLSAHIVMSARWVKDIGSLHMLGTVLLVITAVAIMAVAHRTGTVNAGLLASVVLLFMVMPLTPWGLREAFAVAGLTYLLFTFSALSVEGRFESETLWTLQFLILASATIAIFMIMRNTAVRRDDIRARYDLEEAQRRLELISTRDPLTGAWNRRYLEKEFISIARTARSEGRILHFALLDVDAFKQLNDAHGHQHGDHILRRLVQVLMENLPGTAHVLRLGGDEFAILDSIDDFEAAINRCLSHLETDPRLIEVGGEPVRVSVGFASVRPDETADLDSLYGVADAALYAQKAERKGLQENGNVPISG